MQGKAIPWARPHFWGNEKSYVADALESNWISGGRYVDQFEAEFARYCRVPHAVTSSNGTTALHMAFLALGIAPGDEVLVPGFAFMAAANVALHMGAKPVFAEVDPVTWCMRAVDVERCLTPRTKIVVPVHTYGNVCDMDGILQIAERSGVVVVEDAAEAIGSRYRGRMAGTMGVLGAFSFQATKTITTGEGGAVVTAIAEMCERLRLFRSHGVGLKRYWHDVAGHNFRLTNMQAALGCAQLEKIEDVTRERQRVYRMYRQLLQNVEGVSLQTFRDDVEPVVWAIAVKLDAKAFPRGRDHMIEALGSRNIETDTDNR